MKAGMGAPHLVLLGVEVSVSGKSTVSDSVPWLFFGICIELLQGCAVRCLMGL